MITDYVKYCLVHCLVFPELTLYGGRDRLLRIYTTISWLAGPCSNSSNLIGTKVMENICVLSQRERERELSTRLGNFDQEMIEIAGVNKTNIPTDSLHFKQTSATTPGKLAGTLVQRAFNCITSWIDGAWSLLARDRRCTVSAGWHHGSNRWCRCASTQGWEAERLSIWLGTSWWVVWSRKMCQSRGMSRYVHYLWTPDSDL